MFCCGAFLHVYTWGDTHGMHWQVYTHACVCMSLKLTSGIFINHSSFQFLRQGLSLNLKLANSDSSRQPACLGNPGLYLQSTMPAWLLQESKLWSHLYSKRLSTGLPPQPFCVSLCLPLAFSSVFFLFSGLILSSNLYTGFSPRVSTVLATNLVCPWAFAFCRKETWEMEEAMALCQSWFHSFLCTLPPLPKGEDLMVNHSCSHWIDFLLDHLSCSSSVEALDQAAILSSQLCPQRLLHFPEESVSLVATLSTTTSDQACFMKVLKVYTI